MTKEHLTKLERFKEWNKLSQDSINYAVERYDLLIIAIGTTGIIIALNLIKASFELNLNMPIWIKWVVKTSILSFATSIIFNFYSQLSSKRAFSHEKIWSEEIIDEINGKKIEEEKIEFYRGQANSFHAKTKRCNRFSTLFLAIGFGLLAFVILFSV